MNARPPVYSDVERRLTLISILIIFLLSAMSQTIISTAMPRIVAELSGLQLYAWATTAYLLSSTVSVPIWGKLGDLFGRKMIMLTGVGIFLVGSWLAGLAGEFGDLPALGGGMTQLITFRAIQGLGGGALFTTAFAIIADMFAPRERAKFSALFQSVFALASVFGPVVGGFFTDHGTVTLLGHQVAGWRWVFYVNVPFALAAVVMITNKMPNMPARGRGTIDWLGAILIVAAFVPLLLAVTWAGRDHPWGSPLILSLLGFAACALVAFVIVERAVRDPILPLELFRNRTFTTANAAAFIYSMTFMGVTTFLPLYMQVGQGAPATRSGLTMLALMAGMLASTTVSGQIVTRTGHYKPLMIGGGLILMIGVTMLCFIGPETSSLGLAWRLAIVGVGLGPSQSLFTMAIQNALPFHQIGIATSSSQFTRQIGQTMGVALFGALLTASLASQLDRYNPPQAQEAAKPTLHLDLADLQRIAMERQLHPQQAAARARDPAVQANDLMVRESFSSAMVHCLIFSLTILVVGFSLVLMVPGVKLRDAHVPTPQDID